MKDVKYATPVYAMTILAAHKDSIDTIIIQDADRMCHEYEVLFRVLSGWNHRILLMCGVLPPVDFLHRFFPDMVMVREERPEPLVEYLVREEDAYLSLTFHHQKIKLCEWFFIGLRSYKRVVCFVASSNQREMLRFYWRTIDPDFAIVLTGDNEPPLSSLSHHERVMVITTGYGTNIPREFPDLVVDFGMEQKKKRSYPYEIIESPKNSMRRKALCAAPGTMVLRVMSPSHYNQRDEFYQDSTCWIWGAVFLASLRLPYRDILPVSSSDYSLFSEWGLSLEQSTTKRLKTFLQYPFSVRTHLMLERCRKTKHIHNEQKVWVALAITLVNWFENHHRFLVSRKGFMELQRIYGNDDELFIQMRIAVLLLSNSPLLPMDFIDVEKTSRTFCLHFDHATRLVFPKGRVSLPSLLEDTDKDVIRAFFMTDPRVCMVCPGVNNHIYSYWNTISYISHSSASMFRWVLSTTNIFNEDYATLWVFMPSLLSAFKTGFSQQLAEAHRHREDARAWRAWFRKRVVGYFNEVLAHAPW